jgi:hypothetical protein
VDTLRGVALLYVSLLLSRQCPRSVVLACSGGNLRGVRGDNLKVQKMIVRSIAASAFLLFACSLALAQTPPKFLCQISGDKLTLRVTITNPYDQPTHCQVNCHLSGSAPGSTFSSSCGKTVPAKAGDFLLCEQQLPGKRPYGVVDASSNAECIKPLTDADRKKEDDDDDEFVKKLEKEGLDMLKRLQKAN